MIKKIGDMEVDFLSNNSNQLEFVVKNKYIIKIYCNFDEEKHQECNK
jgi:hypothetical protein